MRIGELRATVAWLAPWTEVWRPHVRHDPERRVFHELRRDERVSVWVISWMPGHDTGLHDHGSSLGAVAVLSGLVREDRLGADGTLATRICVPGQMLEVGPDVVHRVRHHGDEPAVTLHAYSPPLAVVGAYAPSDDGALVRQPVPAGEELLPRSAARSDVTRNDAAAISTIVPPGARSA